MFATAALGFLNHLLDGEAWARGRLLPFSGKVVCFVCGPVEITITLTATGTFALASEASIPDVTFSLPAKALWRAPGSRAAVLAEARINGAADLAEALGFVLRNLRWEIEDDLAPFIGDIAARRLVQGARVMGAWQKEQTRRLALNFSDYFTAELPLIVRRDEFSGFARTADQLSHDADRLTQRLDLLTPPSQ